MRTILACIASLMLAATGARAEEAGKATYDKMCASCHGSDGTGNAKKEAMFKLEPGKLNLGRDEVASQSRDAKKEITAAGKNKMPGYAKKMEPAELDAVMDYTMKLIAAIRKK
jgi:mono/diheme cytochrome c family protein